MVGHFSHLSPFAKKEREMKGDAHSQPESTLFFCTSLSPESAFQYLQSRERWEEKEEGKKEGTAGRAHFANICIPEVGFFCANREVKREGRGKASDNNNI